MGPDFLLWSGSIALLLGTAAWLAQSLQQQISLTGRQIHRSAVHQRELLQVVENHRLLLQVQRVSESLVDEGTATIRTIHKEIAGIPFEILESIPATRDSTRIVRGVHDFTSDGVYATIASVNRLLGRRLRKGMRISEITALPEAGVTANPGNRLEPKKDGS